VTALVVTALAVLSQLYAAIPLLTPVGEALGGNATLALSTGYGLCYAVGFLLWGPVADRYGRRRVMLIGLCLLVSATLACGLTTSLPALALARGAQGLMASSFPPVALAYLSEAVAPRHRATAIGAMSTAFLVAGITGQIGAQAITQRFGWPWVFLGSTCLLTICALAVAWLTREHHRARVTGGPGEQFLAIARLLVRGDVLCLCGAHLTLLLSFVAMYTGLGLHLTASGDGPGVLFLIRLAGLPGMFVALAAGPLGRLAGLLCRLRLSLGVAAIHRPCLLAVRLQKWRVEPARATLAAGGFPQLPPASGAPPASRAFLARTAAPCSGRAAFFHRLAELLARAAPSRRFSGIQTGAHRMNAGLPHPRRFFFVLAANFGLAGDFGVRIVRLDGFDHLAHGVVNIAAFFFGEADLDVARGAVLHHAGIVHDVRGDTADVAYVRRLRVLHFDGRTAGEFEAEVEAACSDEGDSRDGEDEREPQAVPGVVHEGDIGEFDLHGSLRG